LFKLTGWHFMSRNAYDKATAAFDQGWYCAESVLKAIAAETGITSKLIPKIATGLCSGMSRTCGMCGALSGGILALGIVYGRETNDDSVEKNYAAVRALIEKFENRFGSANCRKLIDCDLGTEAGQRKFSKNNLHRGCREYTGKTAEFVSEIIATGRNQK